MNMTILTISGVDLVHKVGDRCKIGIVCGYTVHIENFKSSSWDLCIVGF